MQDNLGIKSLEITIITIIIILIIQYLNEQIARNIYIAIHAETEYIVIHPLTTKNKLNYFCIQIQTEQQNNQRNCRNEIFFSNESKNKTKSKLTRDQSVNILNTSFILLELSMRHNILLDIFSSFSSFDCCQSQTQTDNIISINRISIVNNSSTALNHSTIHPAAH